METTIIFKFSQAFPVLFQRPTFSAHLIIIPRLTLIPDRHIKVVSVSVVLDPVPDIKDTTRTNVLDILDRDVNRIGINNTLGRDENNEITNTRRIPA